MHIVHIASELTPIAKVGGLADVLSGLSRELSWKKHDVDIIIPKYDCMDSNQVRDLAVDYQNLLSFYNGEWHRNTVWVGWVENLKVYFIEPHHPHYFFNRGCYYGCDDDIERYLYFSRAALEFLYKKLLRPDIIHLHDWQTAAIAPLYKDMYNALGFNKSKLVFTIHNIEYQGKCAVPDLDRIGLKGSSYLEPSKLQDNNYPQSINLLKGAIVYSDFITTVSPNYAKEVQTPEGGKGLDKTLLQYTLKFQGILNGIDYSYWNPEIDRYLPAHFSSREFPLNKKDKLTLDKKSYIKSILRQKLSLSEEYRPIVGCIARLVPQKGPELIKYAIKRTLELSGQFVLLGSSPIPEISKQFHELKHLYLDHPHVSLNLHHQEELAHLIYAGADMFIVPSIFEPCGLTQLIALKYGTVPIVRHTGGLADTVFDIDQSTKKNEERNGYSFEQPTPEGVKSALDRAVHCWFENPDKWHKLLINGMNIDYSWNSPSNLYIAIYKKLAGHS
jgi:starch synthase